MKVFGGRLLFILTSGNLVDVQTDNGVGKNHQANMWQYECPEAACPISAWHADVKFQPGSWAISKAFSRRMITRHTIVSAA